MINNDFTATTTSFTIAINKSDFEKIDQAATEEKILNANDEIVVKGKKCKGTWITQIMGKINEFEGTNYMLLGNFFS